MLPVGFFAPWEEREPGQIPKFEAVLSRRRQSIAISFSDSFGKRPVCPLTQFVSLSFFCEKSLICPPGKWSLLEEIVFSSVPPSNSLVGHPSRALDWPRALLLELLRNKDTVKCVALSAGVARHFQEQLTKNLDCALAEMNVFLLFQKFGGAVPPLMTPTLNSIIRCQFVDPVLLLNYGLPLSTKC